MALIWGSVTALALGGPGERKTVVAASTGAELDLYLSTCEQFGFSGSVLVARGNKVILCKGYGEARPGEGVPNGPETLYDIASASKQITAAAILKLESERKLKTSDSIAKHLADVPKPHEEVTIQHLLNHTSGFSRYGASGHGQDRDKAVAEYLSQERKQSAGMAYDYYNGGYALLAAIVERKTGESFESWVTENLFAPAGMQNTYFIDLMDRDDPRLARSHNSGKRTTNYIEGWGYKGMGGVITSISDLHLWMRALMGGKILPKKSLKKLFKPAKQDYACGWRIGDRGQRIYHGGTAPGFQTYIQHFVKEKITVLLVSNREGMHRQVSEGLAAIMIEKRVDAMPVPKTQRWKADKLDALTGRYTSPGKGSLVVRRLGSALSIGAEGNAAIAYLQGQEPSEESPFPWERQRASEIIQGLLDGSAAALAKDVAHRIPKSWPTTVLRTIWPNHLKQHGPLLSFEEIACLKRESSSAITLWIRLRHADGISAVKMTFIEHEVSGLDFKAPLFPVLRPYAPIDKDRFVTFAFTAQSLPEITFKRKGRKPISLELESAGQTHVYERSKK